MTWGSRTLILTLTLFTLLVQLPLTFTGQERQRYQGGKKIGSYIGKADYHFLISNQDTIYDGSFQMQRSSLEALLEKEDASFLFKGNFANGIPQGPWQFRFGEFQSNSESKVVDFEYRVLISGIQEEGLGTITNGKLDGTWRYQVDKIINSEISETLFKSTYIFENGVPQQSFQIASDHAVMVGRFLRNGLAHDEWSWYDSETITDTESWFFEDGWLRSIQIAKDGASKEVQVFDKVISEFKTITLDDRYFTILHSVIDTDSVHKQSGIVNLLRQNAGYYHKIDTLLLQLGNTSIQPKYKVKVPFYPLNAAQNIQLDSLIEAFDSANSIRERLLTNSHLNITKRSDAVALFNYNAAVLISEDFLAPLKKLVAYKKKGILEYLDMGKLLSTLWPEGKPDVRIQVGMASPENTRVFELANASEFDFNGDDLTTMLQITNYAKASLETIQEALSDRLATEEREQELNQIEKDLLTNSSAILKQIDSVNDSLSTTDKKEFEAIKNLVDTSLRTYSSLKNSQEKIAYGTKLKKCFTALTELSRTLGDLPKKKMEIDSLYQDAIWNPFMATVMDEAIKRRITSAYLELVVPHFLREVTDNLKCDTAVQLNQQITAVHRRMYALRNEDTRKLERKLKKEKNPREIIKLLLISAPENNK